ncbi:C-terminal domain of CHU protein family protein [Algoriphagus alkaliphilus]|uniref:C-terminal domain of CHU protein family protein n=1 Tax=Algoriphagus alkaliphilus TaxID=279824 RepID=A0A1G5YV48_9BACT|nr:C-terminal domain of CHU protein family protein [Algoriphagus alkaliphilus]
MISKFLKFSLITGCLILVFLFADGAKEFLEERMLMSSKSPLELYSTGIIGPDRLCIQFGSVIGEFSGGGNALTDVYDWKIFDTSGKEIFNKQPGGFQTIFFTFKDPGNYRVELIVSRAAIPFPKQIKEITVQPSPEVILNSSYQQCVTDPLEIRAINPSDPSVSLFKFEWKNGSGTVVGNNNLLNVTAPGTYTVSFFIPSGGGLQDCLRSLSTTITSSPVFEIKAPSDIICPNQSLTFLTEPTISGNWYIQKQGESTRNFLSTGSSVIVSPSVLPSLGNYEVIFEMINPDVSGCTIEKSKSLTYFPLPDFEILDPIESSGCNIADGGIRIRALTPIDNIFVEETEYSSGPIATGQTFVIPNMESGAYNLISSLGNCTNSYAAAVPIGTVPPELKYELIDIIGESCSDVGKNLGGFTIQLPGPVDGHYRVLNEKGGVATSGSFLGQSKIPVSIAGGIFVFELLDLDSCTVPKKELIEIPGKGQVQFTVAEDLAICQSFGLIPETDENLEFTLFSPDGREETKKAGESLLVDQAGLHKIVGRPSTPSDLCPTLIEFNVTLVDPVEFEPVLIQEDCFGNRTFEAELFGRNPNDLIFKWFNEKDELVSEGVQLVPVSTGLFKLDVQPKNSEACPIPPKEFLIKAPVLEVDVSLLSTKLCELRPSSIITLTTTFQDEVTDIIWRKFDDAGNIIPLPQFTNKTEITVDIEGIYEATVYSIIPSIGKDCELGRNSIEVDVTPERVTFEIPDAISICESYNFSPVTNESLNFTVTYPSGEMVTKASTQTFLLNQQGTYTFFGFDPSANSLLCPDEQTMVVTVNRKIEFAPVLISESCEGIKTYQAVLTGANPADAEFSWMDDQGNEIGNEEFLILDSFGNFALDVQPSGSIPCDQDKFKFEVAQPILNIDIDLQAETLCPDSSSAALTALADFDRIKRLEWWFTNASGVEFQLTNQTDKPEILAIEEGTYEARAFNAFDCLIGLDRVLIMRSTDEIRPEVEEMYTVCPRYEIAETINPGRFASYEWYHEGQLVSKAPTYKPLLIGNFELIVMSAEGCAYQTTFITEEECELRVMHPTAIQIGNPDKQFLIYTNYLIDELEVYIFNKWGEIIFQCANTNLISEVSTCDWDGTFNGKAIPNGSYTIRVNFRNNEKNIQKHYMGSILVIE